MFQRNYSIDILKFACAVLVVFLHTSWRYQDEFLPFTRCAVPCFFMISGFLLYNKSDIGAEKIMKNLKNVVKITLWATALFFVWEEVIALVDEKEFFVPSVKHLIYWLFLNFCPFGGHLWYLYAYIYVLIFVYYIDKFSKWRCLFLCIPMLLATDLSFGKYGLLFWNQYFPVILVRNFMFVGLPYFSIDALIKHYDGKIHINKYLPIWGRFYFC